MTAIATMDIDPSNDEQIERIEEWFYGLQNPDYHFAQKILERLRADGRIKFLPANEDEYEEAQFVSDDYMLDVDEYIINTILDLRKNNTYNVSKYPKYARKYEPYPSEVSDKAWAFLEGYDDPSDAIYRERFSGYDVFYFNGRELYTLAELNAEIESLSDAYEDQDD